MITQGVGYNITNSTGGYSLTIDPIISIMGRPFEVYEDSDANGLSIIKVKPGHFNNYLPKINGVTIGDVGAHFARPSENSVIFLSIPASEKDDKPFPDGTPELEIAGGLEVPYEANENFAYVAIANIKVTAVEGGSVLTINQMVVGSIWGEKFKCGSQLDYWFSHI